MSKLCPPSESDLTGLSASRQSSALKSEVVFTDVKRQVDKAGGGDGLKTPKNPEKQDLSCFDILNVFRSRWFISRDKLVTSAESSQKDEKGEIVWVEFSREYHSHLVKCGMALLPSMAFASLQMAKKAIFVFILEVLNREAEESFFALQRGKTHANRAQQEKNRLSRKRSRAAKRERAREEPKALLSAQVPQGNAVKKEVGGKLSISCSKCSKAFKSRKRAKKHTCKVKVEQKEEVKPEPAAPSPPAGSTTTPKLSSSPPVTVPSEEVEECHFCPEPATTTKVVGDRIYVGLGEYLYDSELRPVCPLHKLTKAERSKLKRAQKRKEDA